MKVRATYSKTIEVEINDKYRGLGEYWGRNTLRIPASEFDECGKATWDAVLQADPSAAGGSLCYVEDELERPMVEY